MWRSSNSTLTPPPQWLSFSPGVQPPHVGNSFQLLASTVPFFQSLHTVHDWRWESEHKCESSVRGYTPLTSLFIKKPSMITPPQHSLASSLEVDYNTQLEWQAVPALPFTGRCWLWASHPALKMKRNNLSEVPLPGRSHHTQHLQNPVVTSINGVINQRPAANIITNCGWLRDRTVIRRYWSLWAKILQRKI